MVAQKRRRDDANVGKEPGALAKRRRGNGSTSAPAMTVASETRTAAAGADEEDVPNTSRDRAGDEGRAGIGAAAATLMMMAVGAPTAAPAMAALTVAALATSGAHYSTMWEHREGDARVSP